MFIAKNSDCSHTAVSCKNIFFKYKNLALVPLPMRLDGGLVIHADSRPSGSRFPLLTPLTPSQMYLSIAQVTLQCRESSGVKPYPALLSYHMALTGHSCMDSVLTLMLLLSPLAVDLVTREKQRPKERGRASASKSKMHILPECLLKTKFFSSFKKPQTDHTADGYFCCQ